MVWPCETSVARNSLTSIHPVYSRVNARDQNECHTLQLAIILTQANACLQATLCLGGTVNVYEYEMVAEPVFEEYSCKT